MNAPLPTCPSCGSTRGFDPGFLRDNAQNRATALRWMQGEPEYGPMGGLRVMGKDYWDVSAHRCRGCGMLTLFVL